MFARGAVVVLAPAWSLGLPRGTRGHYNRNYPMPFSVCDGDDTNTARTTHTFSSAPGDADQPAWRVGKDATNAVSGAGAVAVCPPAGPPSSLPLSARGQSTSAAEGVGKWSE